MRPPLAHFEAPRRPEQVTDSIFAQTTRENVSVTDGPRRERHGLGEGEDSDRLEGLSHDARGPVGQ